MSSGIGGDGGSGREEKRDGEGPRLGAAGSEAEDRDF